MKKKLHLLLTRITEFFALRTMKKRAIKNRPRKIEAVLAFLKKNQAIRFENEVIKRLGLKPQTLTFAKGKGNDLSRGMFESGNWTRESLLVAILDEYEVEEFNGGFRFTKAALEKSSKRVNLIQYDPDIPEIVHHFVYYFRESQKSSSSLAKKGKLIISQFPDHEHAFLTFRDTRGNLVVYEGSRMNPVRTAETYFWLEQNGAKGHPSAFSCLILNPSPFHYESKIIFGVFSAKGPSCGKIVLEKCDSQEALDEAFDNPLVNPWISSLLVFQRIEANDASLPDWEEHDSFSYTEKLNSVRGVFNVYTLNQKRSGVSKHVIEINLDGTANLNWQFTNEKYSGLAKISEDRANLNLYFDFQKELQDYQIRFLIKLDNSHTNSLFGVFYGIERTHNDPMGGKCFFQKTEEQFDDLLPTLITGYEELMEVEGLVGYFRGSDDHHQYGDSPALVREILGERLVGEIDENMERSGPTIRE
ncbi:MAG: hypothetical protein IPJ40_18315 [Saprospirales bacterium]|nr:hypothetical protein [Saprospirales bacterium]